MKRVSVFTLLFALLLIGAQAGSASAATHLELSAEGETLEVGTPIETSSSGMTILTGAGNVTCEESTMEGTVTVNNSSKDGLQFTSAQFRKAHPYPNCTSTLALGEPTVTASGFPWSLDLTKKADGKLKGSKKLGLTLAFPGATCVMEGSSAKDTFSLPLGIGEEAIPLELSLTGLKLKLAKGSGAGCPGSGTFEEPGLYVSASARPGNSKTTRITLTR